MRPVGKEFVISGTLLGLTNDAGSTGLLEMSPEACGLQRHSVLFKASEGIPEFNMPHELSGMETGFLWRCKPLLLKHKTGAPEQYGSTADVSVHCALP